MIDPMQLAEVGAYALVTALAGSVVAALLALARWLWRMPRQLDALERRLERRIDTLDGRLDGLATDLVEHMRREESERGETRAALVGVHQRVDALLLRHGIPPTTTGGEHHDR